MEDESNGRARVSPLEIDPEQFRLLGHELIDRIAGLLDSLPTRPVTRGESPLDIRKALDADRGLPSQGTDPGFAVRALLVQWASAILGIHYFICDADRGTRRVACRCGKSECWCVAAFADGE
jgi:hypothetical protein